MVLVDTSIWSMALRRRTHLNPPEQKLVNTLIDLIKDGKSALIGMIRQEILSGIRDAGTYESLREKLTDLPYVQTGLAEYDMAAEFYNRCVAKGIKASAVDMFICAAAATYQMPIFTTDADFRRYAKHLPVELFQHT